MLFIKCLPETTTGEDILIIIIIIIVIFKCYFSGELIALSIIKNNLKK